MKLFLVFVFMFLTVILTDCSSSKHLLIKKEIMGVWGTEGGTENDFKIEKDSIYYIDYEKYYKYFFTTEDTLIIHFDGFIEKYKVVMHGRDTMVTINSDSTITYFIKSK